MQQKRRPRIIAIYNKMYELVDMRSYPPEEETTLHHAWDDLLRQFPKSEGYLLYEGVASSKQEFEQRYGEAIREAWTREEPVP